VASWAGYAELSHWNWLKKLNNKSFNRSYGENRISSDPTFEDWCIIVQAIQGILDVFLIGFNSDLKNDKIK
jgi:hypothetical protein